MKNYTKIALLVALALFLTLAACQRQVATSPVATATSEVPFPVGNTPVPVNQFATQTALAQASPQVSGVTGQTPQVSVVTETPAGGQPTGGQAGQPTATQAAGQTSGTTPGTAGQATATPGAAAATSLPPLPMPTITRPATYTLQNGEFPYCIARRYNLDVASLLSSNGLGVNSKPGVGTVLKIPTTGSWDTTSAGTRALAKHPTTYTVQAGDNVYSIACKYGDVAPEQILANNGLTAATQIKTGMNLNIP